ncbi:MAG: hypothetical protein KGL10_05630 [Alphaproteobacteria bacterium]|nr:hypothetical protein [Alphaproteobacteria bacterium]MDE2336774.1 hypothetical protein [Alphaproteobacteria bacterium]
MPAQKPRIAFQGIAGAYSDIAADELYPACKKLCCATFADALAALDENRADRALIPVTNTIAGPVTDALAALRAAGGNAAEKKAYAVEKILWLPVRHCLLALPEARIDDLRAVYSHWQALAQCRKSIARLRLKPVEAGDTAGAAKQVAAAKDAAKAVIASAAAAKTYGLAVLKENFEDAAGNRTLFFAVVPADGGQPSKNTPLKDALKMHGL